MDHKYDYAYGELLPGRVGQSKRLLVYGRDEARTDMHACAEAEVEVLVQDGGLGQAADKHEASNRVATVDGLGLFPLLVAHHKAEHLLEEHGLCETEQVVQCFPKTSNVKRFSERAGKCANQTWANPEIIFFTKRDVNRCPFVQYQNEVGGANNHAITYFDLPSSRSQASANVKDTFLDWSSLRSNHKSSIVSGLAYPLRMSPVTQ